MNSVQSQNKHDIRTLLGCAPRICPHSHNACPSAEWCETGLAIGPVLVIVVHVAVVFSGFVNVYVC